MFQLLTHVELSRSKAAILEMPQYVAYQKHVPYALFTLSTKSYTLNRYCIIRRRSYVIIGFVAPAIGPNKSKKLTRLISPTHNIRGKV